MNDNDGYSIERFDGKQHTPWRRVNECVEMCMKERAKKMNFIVRLSVNFTLYSQRFSKEKIKMRNREENGKIG